MKRVMAVGVLVALALATSGCRGGQVPQVVRPDIAATTVKAADAAATIQKENKTAADAVVAARNEIKTAADAIGAAEQETGEVANDLEVQAKTIRMAAPREGEPVAAALDTDYRRLTESVIPKLEAAQTSAAQSVIPKLDAAHDSTVKVDTSAGVVAGQVVLELRQADARVTAMEKESTALRTQVTDLKAEHESGIKHAMVWLAVGGVVILAVGIFLAVKGSLNTGLAVSGGGLLLIGSSTLVYQCYKWIEYGAAIVLAAVLVGIVYSIVTKQNIAQQLVQWVQANKEELDPEALAAKYGIGNKVGEVASYLGQEVTAFYNWCKAKGVVKSTPPAAPAAPPPAPAPSGG